MDGLSWQVRRPNVTHVRKAALCRLHDGERSRANPVSAARVSGTGVYRASRVSSEAAGSAALIRYSFISYQVEGNK